MLTNTNADCAILNSGALRSDSLHPRGEFKARDLRNILSFESEIIVLNVTGQEIHDVLENCVSKYDSGGGRYPQVSGIFFAFDPSKPPGNRIDNRIIKIQDEYLELEKVY
jgi:5'-nucleotidase